MSLDDKVQIEVVRTRPCDIPLFLKTANDKGFSVVVPDEEEYDKVKKICDDNNFTNLVLLKTPPKKINLSDLREMSEIREKFEPRIIITQSSSPTSIDDNNQKQLRQIQKSQFRAQQKNMRFKNK